MANTDIGQVKSDMEVLEDVKDSKGNVLLKKGSTLTQVWIERLKKRGITHVDVAVESSQSPDSPEEGQANKGQANNGSARELPYEDLQAHMKKIFTPVLGQPYMKSLARATYVFLKDKNS